MSPSLTAGSVLPASTARRVTSAIRPPEMECGTLALRSICVGWRALVASRTVPRASPVTLLVATNTTACGSRSS